MTDNALAGGHGRDGSAPHPHLDGSERRKKLAVAP